MHVDSVPPHPKIILFANGKVGLSVVQFLKKRKENIVALVLHHDTSALLVKEIIKASQCKRIYYANELREAGTIIKLKKLKPDIGISAWFGFILKPEVINLFPSGCINCHNSYLPYNQGKYPHVWAIAKQSPYGVTIHYIDQHIDTGHILSQKRLPIAITDTGESLYEKSLEEVIDLFIHTWPLLLAHRIRPKKQNKAKASFHKASQIDILDRIDINKKYLAKDIINQIRSRSFYDRTYAYFFHKGKKVYIKITLGYTNTI